MTGMDTTAFQRRVYYSQFLKRASGQAGRLHHTGLQGKHQMGQEAEGTRGKCGQDLYGGFCGKEWIKQRKQIDYF